MRDPGISIRPAAPRDVPLILSFIRELAEFEREPHAVLATEALLHRHLFGEGFGRGPVAECVIGEIDGEPQGFALFYTTFSTWLARPGIYLDDLYVRPAARGHGLGKALLAHLAGLVAERSRAGEGAPAIGDPAAPGEIESGPGPGGALHAETPRDGAGRLEWIVLDWNTSAIEFYESQGARLMRDWIVCRLSGEQVLRLAASGRPAVRP